MTTKLLIEINQTLTELLQLLSLFDQEQINVIPFESSWTAGQLAQHLILSNAAIVRIVNGPVKETLRQPDENIKKIKSDFFDFTTKMQSPDFIVPEKIHFNKEDLIRATGNIKTQLYESIETLDLTKTCITELPVGALTRLEAIHFVLYHTQRHIHQLKNIFQKLALINYPYQSEVGNHVSPQ